MADHLQIIKSSHGKLVSSRHICIPQEKCSGPNCYHVLQVLEWLKSVLRNLSNIKTRNDMKCKTIFQMNEIDVPALLDHYMYIYIITEARQGDVFMIIFY